jgi:hypothetical protein
MGQEVSRIAEKIKVHWKKIHDLHQQPFQQKYTPVPQLDAWKLLMKELPLESLLILRSVCHTIRKECDSVLVKKDRIYLIDCGKIKKNKCFDVKHKIDRKDCLIVKNLSTNLSKVISSLSLLMTNVSILHISVKKTRHVNLQHITQRFPQVSCLLLKGFDVEESHERVCPDLLHLVCHSITDPIEILPNVESLEAVRLLTQDDLPRLPDTCKRLVLKKVSSQASSRNILDWKSLPQSLELLNFSGSLSLQGYKRRFKPLFPNLRSVAVGDIIGNELQDMRPFTFFVMDHLVTIRKLFISRALTNFDIVHILPSVIRMKELWLILPVYQVNCLKVVLEEIKSRQFSIETSQAGPESVHVNITRKSRSLSSRSLVDETGAKFERIYPSL